MKKLIIALYVAGICMSCAKEDKAPPSTDYSGEQEFTTAENDFNTIFQDVEKAMSEKNSASLKTTQDCITETSVYLVSDSAVGSYASYLDINFENGCGDFGTVQSGKIHVFFSGRRSNGDYRDSIRFSGFAINGRKIEGIKLTTQIENNDPNSWVFDVDVINGKVTFYDGRSIDYNSNRIRTHSGIATPFNFSDDKFMITGTANGSNSNGNEISTEITEEIVVDGACTENLFRVPVAGEIEFRNETKGITRSINYGEGECDKDVVISAEGYTFEWTVN